MTVHTDSTLSERLDAVLPQTQCRRCGHPDCRSYASAIAANEAAINRCPPGGDEVIAALAELAKQRPVALDQSCGRHGPFQLARVDEARCIGCTLCLAACPVDAIAGAPKGMHTVLAAWCTGCELCIPPCPVDCIELVPAGRAWSVADAQGARRRYEQRSKRIRSAGEKSRDVADAHNPAGVHVRDASTARQDTHAASDVEFRQQAVAAAIARARARRERMDIAK